MEEYKKVTKSEFDWLLNVLNNNKNKSFVQRIINPQNEPVLEHEGGIATHRMSWATVGDKVIAFPTVLKTREGNLQDFGREAIPHVLKTGNYIEFQSEKEADFFSKRYKGAWGGKMNQPPR